LLRFSARSCLCASAQTFLSASIHFYALVLTFSLGFIPFYLVCTSSALLLASACALAHNHYSGIFPFNFFLTSINVFKLLLPCSSFLVCASAHNHQ
jgi:hypothetical protein